jgi:hypothetical protein
MHALNFLANEQRSAAYALFTEIYNIAGEATNEEFTAFCAADNYVAHVLLAHFLAVEFALGEIVLGSLMNPFLARRHVVRQWLQGLVADLPTEWRPFVQWPSQWAQSIPG